MGAEYHINERDELITLTAKGSISSSQACVCVDEMLSDAAFDPALPQLVDLREAEFTGTEDDLKRFETYLLGDYRPQLDASVAIVVNPDWDQETCARAFWMSCALGHAELFDGWNQACKWLIKREFTSNLVDLDILQDTPTDTEDAAPPADPDSAQKPVTPPG